MFLWFIFNISEKYRYIFLIYMRRVWFHGVKKHWSKNIAFCALSKKARKKENTISWNKKGRQNVYKNDKWTLHLWKFSILEYFFLVRIMYVYKRKYYDKKHRIKSITAGKPLDSEFKWKIMKNISWTQYFLFNIMQALPI